MNRAMLRLDDRDLKILTILQKDGRITKTELARQVNLSPTPCWERLKRLEQGGVIEGYGARVALHAFGSLSIIFMEAELASHRAEDFKRFEDAIQGYDDVIECWAVGGGIDYLLKFACADVDTYQRRIDDMLEADIGLRRYFTYVVTKSVKTSPLPPVPIRIPEK